MAAAGYKNLKKNILTRNHGLSSSWLYTASKNIIYETAPRWRSVHGGRRVPSLGSAGVVTVPRRATVSRLFAVVE